MNQQQIDCERAHLGAENHHHRGRVLRAVEPYFESIREHLRAAMAEHKGAGSDGEVTRFLIHTDAAAEAAKTLARILNELDPTL